MYNDQPSKYDPDLTEFYRQKEAERRNAAKRSVSEKMAAVAKLRDLERRLANTRQANKAQRAAKQIKIKIKTR